MPVACKRPADGRTWPRCAIASRGWVCPGTSGIRSPIGSGSRARPCRKHLPTGKRPRPQARVPCFVEPSENRRVGLDAVPQVLQPEVLVGRVLVVVVVRDGKADDRAPGLLLERIHG